LGYTKIHAVIICFTRAYRLHMIHTQCTKKTRNYKILQSTVAGML